MYTSPVSSSLGCPSAPTNLIFKVTDVNGPTAGVVEATETWALPEPNRVFNAGWIALLANAFNADKLVSAFGSQTIVCGAARRQPSALSAQVATTNDNDTRSH